MAPEMRNYRYRQSFCDDRAAEEKDQFLAKMLEYADEALMGKMEQDGDPPDGIVVEVTCSFDRRPFCQGGCGFLSRQCQCRAAVAYGWPERMAFVVGGGGK